jgi:hypothetical protein
MLPLRLPLERPFSLMTARFDRWSMPTPCGRAPEGSGISAITRLVSRLITVSRARYQLVTTAWFVSGFTLTSALGSVTFPVFMGMRATCWPEARSKTKTARSR